MRRFGTLKTVYQTNLFENKVACQLSTGGLNIRNIFDIFLPPSGPLFDLSFYQSYSGASFLNISLKSPLQRNIFADRL